MTSDRHRGVIPALDELGADVAIVANPATRCYLTGFTGDLGAASTRDVVLVSRDRLILLTYPIHTGWATAESHDGVEIRGHRDWIESASETVREAGWRSVAIDDTAMPHAGAVKLRSALPEGVVLQELGTSLSGLRARKDAAELSAMRRSAAITDEVLVEAAGWIEAGMSERAVARRINEAFYRLGADDLAFTVIVASGPNAANPHHRPTDRTLAHGDVVVIDLGCRVDSYCSDLTRTLAVGRSSGRFATLYNATLASRDAALALIAPGRPTKDIARAANDVVRDLGLGDLLMHGLGHGVGLQVHEAPAINESSDDILEVGNVFSVEPGLYDLDWGGVRTEDVVVVTEHGCETITTAPKLDVGVEH